MAGPCACGARPRHLPLPALPTPPAAPCHPASARPRTGACAPTPGGRGAGSRRSDVRPGGTRARLRGAAVSPAGVHGRLGIREYFVARRRPARWPNDLAEVDYPMARYADGAGRVLRTPDRSRTPDGPLLPAHRRLIIRSGEILRLRPLRSLRSRRGLRSG